MEYYVHSSRLNQRRRFSFIRFFAGILIIVFILLALSRFIPTFFKQASEIISPLATTLGEEISSSVSLSDLEAEIQSVINKQKGTWSFYFVDFNSNQRFGINEQIIHTGASVNKLYVLASLYYLAGKDKVDLDDTITLQRKDIADFGTGTIRYDPPGTVYSLKTLARLLTEKSDNTAENILRLRMGDPQVQQLTDQFGMKQTSISDNETSLADVALLMEKMKNGEITSRALTPEMIDLLDKSDFEDRLPAFLPSNARVYHKIGNEVGNIHDVGMVVKDDTSYFIGVLTSDVGDTEEDAKKAIAEISKLVYDFKVNSSN